jgi:hypothetical protein
MSPGPASAGDRISATCQIVRFRVTELRDPPSSNPLERRQRTVEDRRKVAPDGSG